MLLGWLVELPAHDAVLKVVRAELPGMLARLRRSYAPGHAKQTAMSPEDRAWGLMPRVPKFARLQDDELREVFPGAARERDFGDLGVRGLLAKLDVRLDGVVLDRDWRRVPPVCASWATFLGARFFSASAGAGSRRLHR